MIVDISVPITKNVHVCLYSLIIIMLSLCVIKIVCTDCQITIYDYTLAIVCMLTVPLIINVGILYSVHINVVHAW